MLLPLTSATSCLADSSEPRHDALLGWDPRTCRGSSQPQLLRPAAAGVPLGGDAGPPPPPAVGAAAAAHHHAGHPLGAVQPHHPHRAAVPARPPPARSAGHGPEPGSGPELGVHRGRRQAGGGRYQPPPASPHPAGHARRPAAGGQQSPPAAVPAPPQWPWKWLLQVSSSDEVMLSVWVRIFLGLRLAINRKLISLFYM